jgi:hypothetical protein
MMANAVILFSLALFDQSLLALSSQESVYSYSLHNPEGYFTNLMLPATLNLIFYVLSFIEKSDVWKKLGSASIFLGLVAIGSQAATGHPIISISSETTIAIILLMILALAQNIRSPADTPVDPDLARFRDIKLIP